MGVQQQSTPVNKPKATKPVSEARKIRKPLMERKRRERINTCLNDLASLLIDAKMVKTEPGKAIKLEKADILELTVKHIKSFKRQDKCPEPKEDKEQPKTSSYKDGFTKCMGMVDQTLGKAGKEALRQRLLSHLKSCLQKLDPPLKEEESAESLSAKSVSTPTTTMPETSDSSASLSEDRVITDNDDTEREVELEPSNTEKVESQKKEISTPKLTLVPTRLPSGGVAFVIQGGIDPNLLLSQMDQIESKIQPPQTVSPPPSPASCDSSTSLQPTTPSPSPCPSVTDSTSSNNSTRCAPSLVTPNHDLSTSSPSPQVECPSLHSQTNQSSTHSNHTTSTHIPDCQTYQVPSCNPSTTYGERQSSFNSSYTPNMPYTPNQATTCYVPAATPESRTCYVPADTPESTCYVPVGTPESRTCYVPAATPESRTCYVPAATPESRTCYVPAATPESIGCEDLPSSHHHILNLPSTSSNSSSYSSTYSIQETPPHQIPRHPIHSYPSYHHIQNPPTPPPSISPQDSHHMYHYHPYHVSSEEDMDQDGLSEGEIDVDVENDAPYDLSMRRIWRFW